MSERGSPQCGKPHTLYRGIESSILRRGASRQQTLTLMSMNNSSPPASSTEPTVDPDLKVLRQAEAYDRARVSDDSTAAIQRRLLFRQLRGYRRFLDTEPDPDTPMSTWTPLQRTICYASQHAASYLHTHSPAKAVDLVVERLTENQRYLPRGVAEWVVEQVGASVDCAERDD